MELLYRLLCPVVATLLTLCAAVATANGDAFWIVLDGLSLGWCLYAWISTQVGSVRMERQLEEMISANGGIVVSRFDMLSKSEQGNWLMCGPVESHRSVEQDIAFAHRTLVAKESDSGNYQEVWLNRID